MKPCTVCLDTLPSESFPRNRAKPDGLGGQCRKCKRVTQARWYQRNRERHKRNVAVINRAMRAERRRIVADYLAAHPCVDCGETDRVVLEFDHVRGKKVAAVAEISGGNGTVARLLAEIAKCDVRCANCHRRRHAKLRPERANERQTEGRNAS